MKRYFKKICAIILCVSLILTAMPVIQTVSAAQVDTASISTPEQETQEAYILDEIEQRREENVKHFRMSDGSVVAAVYPYDVHYKNAENILCDIDNSLVSQNDGENDVLANKNNVLSVKFMKKSNPNKLYTIDKGDYKIKVALEGSEKVELKNVTTEDNALQNKFELENIQSKVLYSDIFNNTDIEYILNSTKLKENIILKEKVDYNSLVYTYHINTSFEAIQKDSKTIEFCDADGNTIIHLSAPVLWDADGNYSDKLSLEILETKNSKATVKLNWEIPENAVYPVTIDPTLVPAYKATNVKDTTAVYANQGAVNTGYLNTYYMRIGKKTTLGNAEVAGAVYADIPSTIPATARIVNASVGVAFYDIQGPSKDSGITLSAYQITEDWNTQNINEDTILYYDSPDERDTPYIADESLDYERVVDTESYTSSYQTFDITRAAQDWMHNNNNYGIMLRMDSEDLDDSNYLMLFSSDHDVNSPYFVFVYRDTSGLEDYWSYHSASAGNAGTGYVNDFNGNLTFISGIDGESTEKYSVQLNLVYNSNNADSTQFFGKGWRLNVMQKVGSEEIDQAGTDVTYYYYIDSDGTKHYFYDDDGTYKDEDGLGLVYTAVGTSSDIVRYEIKTKDDTTLGFGDDGWLRQIIDANGNKINFNYENGRLDNITNKENQEIFSFTYTSSKITQIKNERSGKVVNLAYSSENLVSVQTVSGNLSIENEYGYDGNLLISATDDTGYRINYGYTHYTVTLSNNSVLFYRVTEVTESALEGENRVNGQTLKIEYDSATRTFFEDGGTDGNINTAEDNNKSTYLFDYYGQPVSVYDSKGRASVFEYNNTEETKHQLSASAYGDKSNPNLLDNPSFETGEGSWIFSGSDYYTTTEDYYHGTKSISVDRIANLNERVSTDLAQELLLDAGTYTFSVYIKSLATEPIDIEVYADRYSSNVSNTLTHVNLEGENGWIKRQVTIEIPEDHTYVLFGVKRENKLGTTLIDAAKVEKSDNATDYNLISAETFEAYNTDDRFFDVEDYWTYSSSSVSTVQEDNGPNGEASTVLKISPTMLGESSTYAKQTITVSGDEKDVYRLSGWAKAAAVQDDESHYRIGVKVVYDDDTEKWHYMNFNKDIVEWQYSSAIIPTDDNNASTSKNYTSIQIYIYYNNQLNPAYFDDIELVKDNVTSYIYDDEGNVISVKDSASQNSYEYDGNSRLTAYADSTGNGFKYAYDSNNNLISAIASGGIEQSYSYNSYGQTTGTAATYNKVYPEIEDGGVYYIRNKSTGKYIDISGDNDADNTNLQQYDFIGSPEYNLQKYTFNKTEDGYYTITANLSATGRKFTVKGGNNADGTNIVIKTADSSDSQKFKLEYAGNGGYRITAKVADGEKALSNYSGDTGNWSHIKLQTIDEDNNNQVFFLEDATAVDTLPVVENGKIYSIRNVKTGNYLTNSNQTALSQGRNGDTEQYFLLEKSGNTEYYYIKAVNATNKVLQISGSNLSFAEKTQSDAQLFSLELVTSYPTAYSNACRFYKIVPKSAQGYSLTCTSSSVTITADYNTSVLWAFEETLVTSSSAVYSTDGKKIISTEDARGTTTTYTYDSKDRLVTGVQVGNQSTTTAYDALDRVSSVSSGDSSVAYNYSGSRLSSINAGGNVYSFTYDGFGNTLSTKIGNRTLATYSYLPYNNGMSRMTYGNGAYVDYTYNSDGNTTEKKYNSVTAVTYDYDNQGRLIRINDHQSGKVTEYVYDFIGRINSVQTSNSSVLAYGYDAENRVSTQTSSAGGVTVTSQYTYDDDGKLTKFDDDITGFDGIEYTYDKLQRVISKNYSDKFNVSYAYLKGKNNQETTLVDTMTVGNDTYRYEYDEIGNISAIYLNGTLYEAYTYDNLNQLKTVTDGTDTFEYLYDNGGNILSVKKNGETVNQYTYHDSGWEDVLSVYNSRIIHYDEIGNPLNWVGDLVLTWSNGRQLTAIRDDIYTKDYRYTYDAEGLRTSKSINGVTTTYTYAEGVLLAQTSGNDTIRFLYDNSGSAYGFSYNGTLYYYQYNLQGDVVGIYDSTGTKVVSYDYSVWGEILSVTGTLASTIGQLNPIRYRGYYYDTETGFYYLNSRYYDPIVKRFINADGYISTGNGVLGYNMFAYCNNNPVNYFDPNGESLLGIIGLLVTVGAVVFGLASCSSPKPAPSPAPTPEPIPEPQPVPNYNDFLNDLGMRESSNNYDAVNQFGYMGRYQLGTMALQDAGFQDSSGNWNDLANSHGIYSDSDFLSSPEFQEVAIREYHKKVCVYIHHYGLDKYVGTVYNGVVVTQSGLLASCHLVGVGDVMSALNSGQIKWDGNGVPAHEYMKTFGGYNISEVW